jgi:hypothetical protein
MEQYLDLDIRKDGKKVGFGKAHICFEERVIKCKYLGWVSGKKNKRKNKAHEIIFNGFVKTKIKRVWVCPVFMGSQAQTPRKNNFSINSINSGNKDDFNYIFGAYRNRCTGFR